MLVQTFATLGRPSYSNYEDTAQEVRNALGRLGGTQSMFVCVYVPILSLGCLAFFSLTHFGSRVQRRQHVILNMC